MNKKNVQKRGVLDNNPFNIISNSEILTKDDIAKLTPLTNELKETFIKAQCFRTRTEMEVSVLNDLKFPTSTLKYWQAVREQNTMFQELVMLSYEYRKNVIKIKIMQRDVNKEPDELKIELTKIEIEKKMFLLKGQEKTAKDRIREIKAWSEIKEREAKNMSEEDLSEVDNGQLIGYTKRWINQSISMGDNGSPSEKQNLIGQLRSGIFLCISKGIIDKVLEGYGSEIVDKIKQEYNIKKIV